MSADGARVHSNGHLQELGDSSQAQSDLEWDDRLVLCCSAVSSGARTDVFAGAVLLPPSHRLDSIDTDPGGLLDVQRNYGLGVPRHVLGDATQGWTLQQLQPCQ